MEERSAKLDTTDGSKSVDALEQELMERAFELARDALDAAEVPVGCVLYDANSERIVGEGRNDTMRTLNATRHAEMVALDQVFCTPSKPEIVALKATDTASKSTDRSSKSTDDSSTSSSRCTGESFTCADDDDELRPLRLHVFVTCEPCIMCAQALFTAGCVERVVFGCRNPRFGGCGTVLDATGGISMEQSSDPAVVERGAAVLKQFYSRDNQRVTDA